MAFSSNHHRYAQQITIFIGYPRKSVPPYGHLIFDEWTARNYNPNNNHLLFLGVDQSKSILYERFAWGEVFKNCTAITRIYIVGHCDAGSDSLQNDEGYSIYFDQLARLIAQQLLIYTKDSALRVSAAIPESPKLRISLLACKAGLPKPGAACEDTKFGQINNSFASRFLDVLHSKDIRCDVAARLGDVCLDKHSEKNTHVKKVFSGSDTCFSHHDLRSKVIYTYPAQSDCQIIQQAYEGEKEEDAWRIRVFFVLGVCIANTIVTKKKQFLQSLMNEFMTKSTNDIYLGLINAIENPLVHTHSSFFGRGATRTFSILSRLLAEYPGTSIQ